MFGGIELNPSLEMSIKEQKKRKRNTSKSVRMAAAATAAATVSSPSSDAFRDSPLLRLCYDILNEQVGFHSAAFLASEVNKRSAAQREQQQQQQQQQHQEKEREAAAASSDSSNSSSNKMKKKVVSRTGLPVDAIHSLSRPVTAAEVRSAIVSEIRHRRGVGPGTLFRLFWHRFCTATNERESLEATLIAKRYRERGLTLVTSPVLVWFLPTSLCGNFLEIRESKIPFAGQGLFLRSDCPGFPRGGILCEYIGERHDESKQQKPSSSSSSSSGSANKKNGRGRKKVDAASSSSSSSGSDSGGSSSDEQDNDDNDDDDFGAKTRKSKQQQLLRKRQLHYSVSLRDGSMVCSADIDGRPMCPAAVANDNGVARRNVVIQEFWTSKQQQSEGDGGAHSSTMTLQGRVFLVAIRDLTPGEEIYCCYGPEYWGAQTYSDIPVVKIPTSGAASTSTASTAAAAAAPKPKPKKNTAAAAAAASVDADSGKPTRSVAARRLQAQLEQQKAKKVAEAASTANKSQQAAAAAVAATASRVPVWQRRQLDQDRKAEETKALLQQQQQTSEQKQEEDLQPDVATSTSSSGAKKNVAVKGEQQQHRDAVRRNRSVSAPGKSVASKQQEQQQPQTPAGTFTCGACAQVHPKRLEIAHRYLCPAASSSFIPLPDSSTSSTPAANVNKKFVPCLPRNEFTTIVNDTAASDGIVGAANNAPAAAEEVAARRDFCLERAVAFAAWNDCMTHAQLDDGDDDNPKGGDNDDSSSRNTSRSGAPGPTKASAWSSSSSRTKATADEVQRATYFPLLRDCERVQPPESMAN